MKFATKLYNSSEEILSVYYAIWLYILDVKEARPRTGENRITITG